MTPDLERAERLAEYFEKSVEGHGILKGMGRATNNEAAENAAVIAQALRACIEAAKEECWYGGEGRHNNFWTSTLDQQEPANGYEFFQRALTVQGEPRMETKILTQEEFAHEILALRDAAADQIGAYLAIGHQAKISDDRKGLLSIVQKQREALEFFVNTFESDFVLDGSIVDNPDEMWSPIIQIYNECRAALALTTEPTA